MKGSLQLNFLHVCWVLKGGEKHFLCIWLKVGTIPSVKPINDFVYEGFCKFAVYKGVIYGVWLTIVNAVAVCIYPTSKELFLCNENPMNEFELKFLQLIFFACFGTHFKNICPIHCVS